MRLGKKRGTGIQHRRATRPNEVWAYDCVFDQNPEGRRLKILVITDEFARECLAIEVQRRLGGRGGRGGSRETRGRALGPG